MAKLTWPKDAKAKKYAEIKQIMTDTGDEKTVGKISKDELKMGLSIDGIELDPVTGGATSATATVLAPGPAGQLRKREASPGWYSVNGQNVQAAAGKRWVWGWNNTAWTLWDMGDLPAADTSNLATKESVVSIQGTRPVPLGALINGRYSTVSATDTNSAYKRSEQFIEVDPTWIGQFSNEQAANTVTVQFDEFKQPIDVLNYTAGVDFSFNPRTKYIIPSGTTANMAAKILTVKESLGTKAVENVQKVVDNKRKDGVSLNYFNYLTDHMYQKTMAMDDGRIVSVSSSYCATPMYRLRLRSALVIGNIFVVSNALRVHWYRADGTHISYQEIATSAFRRTYSTSRYYVISEVPPVDAVYFRVRYEYSSSSTIAMLQRFFISHAEFVIDFETQYTFKQIVSDIDVVSMIRHEVVRTHQLLTSKIALIADSNGAAGNGTASYNTQLRDMNMPAAYEVLAQGGATISSTAKNGSGQQLFGAEYLTLPVSDATGNTFIRQAEVIIDQVINNPSYVKPNVVMVIGGTNDFDKFRHVTPAMIQQSGYGDYIEYMEATFMTLSPAYKEYKPLADVDRGQVAGALRYIIERLGTYLPNTVFLISTPIQSSTEHNAVFAQRTIRDIEWMAGRLSVPVIRMWHESGMPMFWDNKTDKHRYLGDGVHLAMSGVNQPGANVAGRYLSNEVRKKYLPLIEQIVVQ